MHLLLGNLYYRFTRTDDRLPNPTTFLAVVDSVEADDSVSVGDTHHYVRVVDGQPFAVDRLEGAESHGRIFEFAAEEFKQMRVCPLREAGISDTIVAVEYHRACAFEEFAFVFVAGEVYLFFYGEAFVFDVLQYFGAAFEAAVFGKHRVQYHTSARVERHPVVWENTIGRMRRGSIAYRNDSYGVIA